jgi:hypothetical protein
MKKHFLWMVLCMFGLVQANQKYAIEQVQRLVEEAPDKDTFLQSIIQVPNIGISVVDQAKEHNSRLFAALERYRTSLVFSDQDLQEKLTELQLEQEVFDALNSRNLEGVLQLVKNGADSNTTTQGGHTPLILSVLKADPSAVTELLKHGARITPQAEFALEEDGEAYHSRMNALEFARYMGYKSIAKILKEAS